MWLTFVGSWFSFLVQCICLTVLHDLQLPRRLEIILWLRTGPTGRFSYGSGSMWLTFVGSWFSFLVQCICLTVLHDLQLPRRLEIILWLRTGPTGRFS